MRLFRRTPEPDYEHIAQLERDNLPPEMWSVAKPPEPKPKRELAPVTEHALRTLSAKLDPKTGGFILEKNPQRYYTGGVSPSASYGVPGAKWLVNDPDEIQALQVAHLVRGTQGSGAAAADARKQLVLP